jgi:predicted O-linked N-acetylglucosamine transferase (SPINDLY family)
VAASLLHGVGTPEVACDTLPDYEARVMHLATDAVARRKVHEHLVQARDTAPLFDSVGYTRDFENLLWTLADRWSRGLPVDHVVGASVTESAHGETA